MFKLHNTLQTQGAPVLRRHIITNSASVDVMDSVKLDSGFISRATAGDSIFGHVLNIGTDLGVGLSDFTPTDDTFTAESDNQTVDKVKAEVDISKMTLYSGLLNADAGTTTGSDLDGYMVDLADEKTLNESTTATTAAQYLTWGEDPRDDGDRRIIVSIFESQVFGPLAA